MMRSTCCGVRVARAQLWWPRARWAPTIIAAEVGRRGELQGGRRLETQRAQRCLRRGHWWEIYQRRGAESAWKSRSTFRTKTSRPPRRPSSNHERWWRRRRAGFWPTDRRRAPGSSADPGATPAARPRSSTRQRPGRLGNWDIDIWGQIRRTTESNGASAQASAAALAGGAPVRAGGARDRLLRAARPGPAAEDSG